MQFEPTVTELLSALVWCGGFLGAGAGFWRLIEFRRGRRCSLAVAFSLGLAFAVPVLLAGALLGKLLIAAMLYSVLGIAALGIGIGRGGLRFEWFPGRSPRHLAVHGLLFGLALFIALPVLMQPILSYDVLSYHLPIAHALRGGNVHFLDGNYYSRLPLGAFVLYAPLLSDWSVTFDDPGVRVMLLMSIFASAGLCARIAGYLGARRWGRIAAAALLLWHPMVWNCLFNAYSDLLVLMFSLAAFERLLAGKHKKRWLAVSGLMAGTAVGVKFSAAGIVAIPLMIASAIILWPRGRNIPTRAALSGMLLIACGVAAGYLPWMIRAVIEGGHPFHPFMGEASGWSREQAAFLLNEHRPLSVMSAEYWRSVYSRLGLFDYPLRGVGASLLLIGSIVAVALPGRRSAKTALLLASGAGYCAWLTVSGAPARFALPAIGLLAPLAGFVFDTRKFFDQGRGSRAPLMIAAALFLLSIFGGGGIEVQSKYLIGFYDEAWNRSGAVSEEFLAASRETESGDGALLLLFEARQRWFREANLMNTVWDVPPWAEDLKESQSAEEFAQRLRSRGITHVFVNEWEFGRLLDFYGGRDFQGGWGTVGVGLSEEEYVGLLADWPPGRFAGLGAREYSVLRQFLLLSHRTAEKRMAAGPVAQLWLGPLP